MFIMPRYLFFLILLLTQLRCHPPQEDPVEPPNILFIITDDQRFDMMGNMNPVLHTPVMDSLVERGVRFENAFVTTAICAASRASILAGVVERTHRFTFITPALAESFTTNSYPALMKKAGYHTGHIGKFGVQVTEGATDSMFSVFEPLNRNPYFKETEEGLRHLTDITADRAIAFFEDTPEDQPFALTLSFNAPHAEDSDERQYIWPVAQDSLYDSYYVMPPSLSEPGFLDRQPEFLREDTLMNRYRWYWRFDTNDKLQEMTKGYYRMISGVDAAIGRVLEALEEQGVADNTIVMLMGDNGYFLGERGYAGKWLPHELSIRVPLLYFDPRKEEWAGLRPEALALNIDVAPTLLRAAGIEPPASMQGMDLHQLLEEDPSTRWRNSFFVEHLMDHPQIPKHEGVRTLQYKYARYFEQQPMFEELYDLANDPQEINNLVQDPSYTDILYQLRMLSDSLRDAYGGPYTPHEGEPAMLP